MKRASIVLAVLFALLLSACEVDDMVVSPRNGDIVDTSTVVVTGKLSNAAKPGGTLKVNGVTGTFTSERNWQATIPVSPSGYVTVVNVIYTDLNGTEWHQESAVINGPKVPDGGYSVNGVGMKFTNTGLANLGPIINDLAGSSFDISNLILSQHPLVPTSDVGLGHSIGGDAYEAGAESINLTATATNSGVKVPITVKNFYMGLNLNVSGPIINGPCKLEVRIPSIVIDSTFDLQPLPSDPEVIDVNMVGSPNVTMNGLKYEFISGPCDPSTFIIGSIINSAAGSQVESTIRNGFSSQIGDPDGSGPADSPIADAIETALASVSVAGPVGEALKVNLKAPFTAINESDTGIDFRSNADFYSSFGTGPSDCVKPAHGPDYTSSYDVPGTYPTVGGTTPTGNVPYGLGLVISKSAFNQLLSSMTECGMLSQDITALNGVPLSPFILSLLIPQFSTIDPSAQVFVRVDPTAAPFITTDANGPNGSMSQLRIANLHIDFYEKLDLNGSLVDHKLLGLAVEAPLGLTMAFDSVNSQIAPTITPPAIADINTRVYFNGLSVDPVATGLVFNSLFPQLVGGLTNTFKAFPLPEFLGLKMQVLEIAKQSQSYVLYANLNLTPKTRVQNIQVSDLGLGDIADDATVGDSYEWRHRIRKKVSSTSVRVEYRGMIGADACCFADSEQFNAHAGYLVTFDVIPENGQSWKIDLAQAFAGAHTHVNDGGGSATTTISAITGKARINDGAWQNFNITPSPATVNSSGGTNQGISGSNTKTLTGTEAATISIQFDWDLMARSNSDTWSFVAGDEAAIRFGVNDTLANNFTAGEYPGAGNRNLVTDGQVFTMNLTGVG